MARQNKKNYVGTDDALKIFCDQLSKMIKFCGLKVNRLRGEIFFGWYEQLKKVSEMKPIVANASEIFENLIAKFKASDTDKKFKSKQIKFSSNFNGQKIYSTPKI